MSVHPIWRKSIIESETALVKGRQAWVVELNREWNQVHIHFWYKSPGNPLYEDTLMLGCTFNTTDIDCVVDTFGDVLSGEGIEYRVWKYGDDRWGLERI
jgi:hypothetical protein